MRARRFASETAMPSPLRKKPRAGSLGFGPESRQVVLRFLAQVFFFVGFVAVDLHSGRVTAPQAVLEFSKCCAVGTSFRIVATLIRCERPGGPALNSWDEILGLTATCTLAHGLARFLS